MESLKCSRCRVSWVPRIQGRPKQCPSCHSPYWDKDRVRGVVVAAKPVKASRVPVVEESKPDKIARSEAACKCGGSGVMLVGGKKCCAKCGRALGD
jgi:hypothetical protein